jgi:hypothetical protein
MSEAFVSVFVHFVVIYIANPRLWVVEAILVEEYSYNYSFHV